MDVNIVVKDIKEEIKAHRGWYIFEGFLFLLMGLLAILLPDVVAVAVTLLLGSLLFVGEVARVATFFRYPKQLMKLLSGLLFIMAGLVVAFFPLAGLVTLAVLISAVLLLEGLFEILFSLAFKPFLGWK